MKRCVIYARATAELLVEESIEAQIKACETYAKEQGWVVIKTYAERTDTETSDNRPVFQEMLNDSKNKEFEGVLVHKLDRFSRNQQKYILNEKKLNINGVQLISVLEKIDNSPEGQLMKSVMLGFNTLYNKENSVGK